MIKESTSREINKSKYSYTQQDFKCMMEKPIKLQGEIDKSIITEMLISSVNMW